MTSKEKNKHKFGDWLLKQEDEAGFYSYKRSYIPVVREGYIYNKLKYYFLGLVLINGIILLLSQNVLVWIITLISDFIIVTALLIMIPIKYSVEMDEYSRTEFDKMYGKGKYDEVMKKIKEEKKVVKWM
jgi:hypothetical protein